MEARRKNSGAGWRTWSGDWGRLGGQNSLHSAGGQLDLDWGVSLVHGSGRGAPGWREPVSPTRQPAKPSFQLLLENTGNTGKEQTKETYPETLTGSHWGSLISSCRDLVILVNLVENIVGKLDKLHRIHSTCLPSPDSSRSLSDSSIEEPESSCQ